ncbi:MAG: aminotransferase class V-fold PLP-dependent enzyme [Blautia sp.]
MIYLDNSATTMKKPDCVKEAVLEAMENLGNCGRGGHPASLHAARTIYEAREAVSDFFQLGDPSGVVFTANATEALNVVIQGLFSPGDHVITTALEHNSVLRPLYMQEKKGVSLTILPADQKGNISCEDLENAIQPRTRAVVCTHGSNVTGNLVDIEQIGQICRRHGLIFVVDGSQTAGIIPLSMKTCKIDVLCFTGHKGIMGPQGTGGLCVVPGIFIRPLKSGGSGIRSFDREQPDSMPERLEAGTLNGHGIAGLLAAIGYLQETGVENIFEADQQVCGIFYEKVRKIKGIRLYGDFSSRNRMGVVSLNLGDLDSAYVSDRLAREFGIYTRAGAHCAPLMHKALGTEEQGCVRFSFSWFNTQQEAEEAAEALKIIAEEELQ